MKKLLICGVLSAALFSVSVLAGCTQSTETSSLTAGQSPTAQELSKVAPAAGAPSTSSLPTTTDQARGADY